MNEWIQSKEPQPSLVLFVVGTYLIKTFLKGSTMRGYHTIPIGKADEVVQPHRV